MNKQQAIEKIKSVAYNTGTFFKVMEVSLDKVIEIVEQIDVPQMAIVPKFVGEWIEERKKYDTNPKTFSNEVAEWLNERDYNECLYYRAWYEGYEIGEEQLYTVKFIKTGQYLHKVGGDYTFVTYVRPEDNPRMTFTKSELNRVGLSGIFDNPMFEVEEVEC